MSYGSLFDPCADSAFAAIIDCRAAGDAAQTIEEKAQLCAACHGENGIPQEKTMPVIWGQYQGYLYLQLRDLQERRAQERHHVAAGRRRSSATT